MQIYFYFFSLSFFFLLSYPSFRSLSLSLSEKVFRAPGKFNARDFIKVFPRRSMQSKGGLYLCGAGGETDESTIKELLIQEALGCSVGTCRDKNSMRWCDVIFMCFFLTVAIVHDLFERKQTLVRVCLCVRRRDSCVLMEEMCRERYW